MSKRGYISRYLLIVKRLKSNPYSSYDELKEYVNHQSYFLQANDDDLFIAFSKRTLQRDLREIRNLFGIDILYSRVNNGYFIAENTSENMNFQRMVESFDMFNALNVTNDLKSLIHLEKRKPQGSEHIYGLIHALKNNLTIKFDYQKFWDEKKTNRELLPYGLKDFKNRWYIVGTELNSDDLKIFGLDRLSNLEITKKKSNRNIKIDIEEYFKNSFGIIGPNNLKSEKVVLSFQPLQGKYIKSLPLHSSQRVIKDNQEEMRIELNICITHDFVMELLSHGEEVKVLKPASLVKKVKKILQDSLLQYS